MGIRNLCTPPLLLFVLREETLTSYSLDSLFVLMVEKIQTIKLLDRFDPNDTAYSEMKKDINLIQKVIKVKESQTGESRQTLQRGLTILFLFLLPAELFSFLNHVWLQ